MPGAEDRIWLRSYWRPDVVGCEEARQVQTIAEALQLRLAESEIYNAVVAGNRERIKSTVVERAMAPAFEALGFQLVPRGLFSEQNLWPVPDAYRPLGETGILAEVERGMTVTNCRDIYDFWKCHVCSRAHYLFLLVPIGPKATAQPHVRGTFVRVERRLSPFFQPGGVTNVRGLCLFGY